MKPCETKHEAKSDRGIRCPRCGCGHWRVIYTRPSLTGRVVRRRECRHCGRRITTHEHDTRNAFAQPARTPHRGICAATLEASPGHS